MPTYKENLHLGTKDPVIGGDDLAEGIIGTLHLEDGAVTTPKIANGAVTWDKLSTYVQRLILSASGMGDTVKEVFVFAGSYTDYPEDAVEGLRIYLTPTQKFYVRTDGEWVENDPLSEALYVNSSDGLLYRWTDGGLVSISSVNVVSIDDLDGLTGASLSRDPRSVFYAVTCPMKGGAVVDGVLFLFSDNLAHSNTQVLITHHVLNSDGTISEAHNDNGVGVYWRAWGLSTHPTHPDTWSPWQYLVPDYNALDGRFVSMETILSGLRSRLDTDYSLSDIVKLIEDVSVNVNSGKPGVAHFAGTVEYAAAVSEVYSGTDGEVVYCSSQNIFMLRRKTDNGNYLYYVQWVGSGPYFNETKTAPRTDVVYALVTSEGMELYLYDVSRRSLSAVSAGGGNLSELSSQLTELRNTYTADKELTDGRFASIENSLSDQSATLDTHTSELSGLDGRVSTFESRLAHVERLKEKCKGLFSTLTTLEAAYPSPELGDWALVGGTSPFDVYECATNGLWSSSGGTWDAGTIDLGDYVTYREFDEVADIVLGGDESSTEVLELTSNVSNTSLWSANYWISDTSLDYKPGDKLLGAYLLSIGEAGKPVQLMIVNGGAVRVSAISLGETSTTETYFDLSSHNIVIQEGDAIAIKGLPHKTSSSGKRYVVYTSSGGVQGYASNYAYNQKIKVRRSTSGRSGNILDRIISDESQIDGAMSLAQDAYDLASAAGGGGEPSHDVYRHATDPEHPSLPTIVRKGHGLYTTLFDKDKRFNSVILKSIKASAADTDVEWRVNVFANSYTNFDYIPRTSDGPAGETLKSGTVTVGEEAEDIVLTFDETLTCPAGMQVIVYLLASGGATLVGGGVGTLSTDTHGTVANSSGEWSGTWTMSNPSTGSAYRMCAPVLRYESNIMSKGEIEAFVEEKVSELGIDVTPTHEVYRHANDGDNPTGAMVSARGHAVYTPPFDEEKKFNEVTVKRIAASVQSEVEWRVYVNPSSGRPNDGAPTNQTKASGTLASSGTCTIGTQKEDLVLRVGTVVCPAGCQVIVYFLNVKTDAKLVMGAPTVSADTHVIVTTSGADGWDSKWGIGAYPTYICCAPILRWESSQMTREEIESYVDAAVSEVRPDDYKIVLADELYCLVGSEVNVYNERVAMSVDKGENSPINYIVEWKALSDKIPLRRSEHGIRLRPTTAGRTQVKCTLLDLHDHVLDEKVITIYAVARDALAAQKNLLFVGDSWVQDFNMYTYRILNGSDTYNDSAGRSYARFTGVCPTFCGTQVHGTARSEGRGGWTWKAFADEDDPVDQPGAEADFSNEHPFLNPTTGKLDISYYRGQLGMGTSKFDMVIFRLGENDITKALTKDAVGVEKYVERLRTSVIPYMDALIRAFASDNASCKILVTLQCEIDNRWVGYDSNLSYRVNHWEKIKSAYALNLLYHEWADAFNAESGSQQVILSNATACIDPFYGMQHQLIPVNDRWAKSKGGGKKLFGGDFVHPSGIGYSQMSDELAAEIAGRLGTVNTETTAIGYQEDGYYGNADEVVVNGKGVVFHSYKSGVEPTLTSGTLTKTRPHFYYYAQTDRFLAVDTSSTKYYSDFSAKNVLMTNGHPKPDMVYWLGDVPYLYDGEKLVKAVSMMGGGGGGGTTVDQTARDAASSAQETADDAYTLADTANSAATAASAAASAAQAAASAALPSSRVWVGTQSEYDALPSATKSNIIAFIKE